MLRLHGDHVFPRQRWRRAVGDCADGQLPIAAEDRIAHARRGRQAADGVRAAPLCLRGLACPGLTRGIRRVLRLGDADDAVFSDSNSKQKGGTVGKVTRGMIDRTAYYEHALHLALVPFLHEESFPGLYDS